MILPQIFFFTISFPFFFSTAFAVFNSPLKAPPQGNPPPPITSLPEAQTKTGNLEVKNIISEDGIILEGIKKSAWGPDGGGSCTWEGVKCDCRHDSATWNELAITIAAGCSGGSFDGIKVKSIKFSSSKISCSSKAPEGCTPSLYTYKNAKRSTSESIIHTFLGWF